MTNKCTIISQIITLPHVSTLSCHPQGAYNQYLAKLHKSLCPVDHAPVYNLVNNAKLVHHLFLVCLFLFSTCFGQLCAHHQEKQLCICDTWYLLSCTDDCPVYRVQEWSFVPPCIPDSHPYRIKSTKRHIGCLYYLYQWCTVQQLSDNETYLLIKNIVGALHHKL
jgi:hypothetical protein